MKAVLGWLRNEPVALIVAAAGAIVGVLASFGIGVTTVEKAAILAAIPAVLGLLARQAVVPTAKAKRAKAKTAGRHKFGKRPVDLSKPSLKFGDHLKLTTVPAHPGADTLPALPFGMDENDSWGDCVCAGWDHFQYLVSKLLTGTATAFTEAQLLALYRTQNPTFDPNGSPTTNGPGSDADGGMEIQTMLSDAVKQGWAVGFAKVDHTNIEAVKAAVYLGLGVITGETLSADNEQSNLWDATNKPSIGGHCTVTASYTATQLGVITWGSMAYAMTPAFLSKRVDEVWFVITQAHVDDPAFRAGFDLTSFGAAFTELTGKPFPAVIPTPTPAPVVPPAPTPTPAADADTTLAAAARKFVATRHSGASLVIQKALQVWLAAKGLQARPSPKRTRR